MRKIYVIALATLAVTLIALPLFRSSEEDKILDRLDELRGLAEISETVGAIAQLARARQLSGYFTEQTRFDLSNLDYGAHTIGSREELARIFLKGRATLTSLELVLRDAEVTIDGDRAEVQLQASALGIIRGERGRFLDIHRVRIVLARVEGEWLISGGQHLFDEREHPGESIKELYS